MIAKRAIAALFAVGLILSAWVVRDRIIEDDDEADAADDADEANDDRGGDHDQESTLVCASELRDVCRDVADRLGDDMSVRIAEAGDTLDELSSSDGPAPMWLTFHPFPEMVDELRRAGGQEPIAHDDSAIASSPLAAVVLPDSTDALVEACGDPVDLACLADQRPLSPTFAPIDTGIGTLGVAAAVAAYGGGSVDLNSLDLLTWARKLEGAGFAALSGGTAVQTIQTRPSFAVAIGAEAELASARRDAFDVLYAEPMTSADVVLMVPDGADPPGRLASSLGEALQSSGWRAPNQSASSALPAPGVIVAIRDFWEDLN
jgi:hypothetical protein